MNTYLLMLLVTSALSYPGNPFNTSFLKVTGGPHKQYHGMSVLFRWTAEVAAHGKSETEINEIMEKWDLTDLENSVRVDGKFSEELWLDISWLEEETEEEVQHRLRHFIHGPPLQVVLPMDFARKENLDE